MGVSIVAVDPGALHTGVVYMDNRRVIDVATISYPKAVKGDNHLLDERCEAIWRRLWRFLADHPHDCVVVEGYQQQGGRGHMAMSHQTPWVVGSLTAHLHREGEDVRIQTSAQVLNPKARNNCAWVVDAAKDGREVCPGSEKCRNEHLRSALAHGVYWMAAHGCR